MNLERGTLLYERYRIVDILGEGGMGAVYRGVDENLGVEVAVKENFFTSEEYARQFHREASILANLRHPNLPRVTDHFVIEDQGQYLVMDFMEGEDLRERIDRLATLSDDDVIVIGIAICDALTYLHKRNPVVIHRDIKPGNVKIMPSGEVSLVDFGLAKVVEGDGETTPGARAMTPGYSPPEQYGTARTGPRTDIYSLGATLYEALTGAVPEDGLSRVMEQANLSPVRKRNSSVSRRLAGVIQKALAVRPEDRYQSAEEFKNALIGASRSLTKRSLKTGELAISPPPTFDRAGFNNEREPPDISDLEPIKPFPVSAAIPQTLPPVTKIWGRLGILQLLVVLVLGVIVGGSAGLFFYYPDLTMQALAVLFPSASNQAIALSTQTKTPIADFRTLTASAVGGGIVLAPTLTPSPEPSLTATPTSSATFTETPQPTMEDTPTPTATLTPTIPPTPLGGGFGEIVFASNRTGVTQLWVINSDGSGLRRITDMPDGACQPAWSPDGSRLVFISPCERNAEIYQSSSLFIIDADGNNLTPLPTILGGDYDPAWAPDGKTIAFTSLRKDNRPQIYFYDLEEEEISALSDDIARDFQPSWSPDGLQLIFVTTRRGPYQIWVSEVGGRFQELFSRSGGDKNTYPSWSPDGQAIIFNQSKSNDGVITLVGVRFENEEYFEFRLFYNRTPSQDAKFSPDGSWIVFESWPNGENHDIYLMTPNGVDMTRLTEHPGLDFDPAWRPIPALP
jgi:serine/threonine protein kinase/Tol biopolymer transport system component